MKAFDEAWAELEEELIAQGLIETDTEEEEE